MWFFILIIDQFLHHLVSITRTLDYEPNSRIFYTIAYALMYLLLNMFMHFSLQTPISPTHVRRGVYICMHECVPKFDLWILTWCHGLNTAHGKKVNSDPSLLLGWDSAILNEKLQIHSNFC